MLAKMQRVLACINVEPGGDVEERLSDNEFLPPIFRGQTPNTSAIPALMSSAWNESSDDDDAVEVVEPAVRVQVAVAYT